MFPLRQRSKQSDLTKEIKKAPAGIAMENQTHQTQALSFVFFLMSFKLGPSPLGHLANTRLPEVPFLPPPAAYWLLSWAFRTSPASASAPPAPESSLLPEFSLGWCLLTVSRLLPPPHHPSLSAIATCRVLCLPSFAIRLPSPSLPRNHSHQSHNELLVLILFDLSVALDPKDHLLS